MTIVSGPVHGGAHGWPFGAATVDLDAEGYVEEEYFVEGTASRYRAVGEFGPDGLWEAEPIPGDPFKTRIVVRRPIDPDRFNGTVIVEWNNVTSGCEIFEAGDTRVIFDEGFAYVGVSAQQVGVHGFATNPQGLIAWDEDRYGTLQIDDDGLSYGIFAAAARAVGADRVVDTVDPLAGLDVRRVIAVGGSQSAWRLTTFLNAVEPLEHVFDAFVPFTWFGSGTAVDDATAVDVAAGGRPVTYPTRLRTDLGVPVMVVNSECETLSCFPVRQPDSEFFRYWEVAGAPHGPRLHIERIAAKMTRDGVNALPLDDLSMLSPVPWAPVLDAALGLMPAWIDGEAPPSQAPIAVTDDPRGIERDDDGNAIGGVRVPELDAPIGRHVAAIEECKGGLMGDWFPFDDDVLRARYGDAAGYVKAYTEAAASAMDAGILRPADVESGIRRAEATNPLS